ncbi:MAG: pyridoxal phosphate-dependent aminotransferase [Mesorhizobium amorphae]|nr:MAG: pyridoxal phosphate-dependent aminotransferase [Mesorhizobium amorphae]
MLPPLTPLAESLPQTVPFVGPETQERARGAAFRARLGANENGFGPSPAVVARMTEAAPTMWRYCDPENHELRQALAVHLSIPPERIAVGEGIDGLLGLVVRLFVREGVGVVSSLGAYPTFNFHVAGFGGRLVFVPYRDDRESLEALLAAAWSERPRLVYLANPDNPMGSWWDAASVMEFARALPADALLLLDEAYGEFAPPGTLPPSDWFQPNVLRLRTFSKAYGLAGLRLGYAFGDPAITGAFDKVRNHFGVNRMAQAAGVAALADTAYLAEVTGLVSAARERIGGIARQNGLTPLPSATNFVAIDCGADGTFALAVLQALADEGVFVRKPMAPGLDRCIRVSVGPESELDVFAEALPTALRTAKERQAV